MSLYLEGIANELSFQIQQWRRTQNCDPLGFISISLDVPPGILSDAIYSNIELIMARCRLKSLASTNLYGGGDQLTIQDYNNKEFYCNVRLTN
jgi:hypothetical protein